MASDVDCACDEGKNEIKWQNWQKGDHGGVELACMNPGVCVPDTRDGRGPTDACYFGVFEAKRTSQRFCYSRNRLRQQASCLPI